MLVHSHPTHALCPGPFSATFVSLTAWEQTLEIHLHYVNSQTEMPYLVESNEWRLLQGLGRLLGPRKARYQLQTGPLNDHNGVRSHAELIEVELRRVFMVKEITRNLDPAEFAQFQAKLTSLCLLLDGLARSSNAHSGPEGPSYPRLRALTGFLESTSGPVDLASGPNETLFRLPRDAGKLWHCLGVVTECNDALSRLLVPSTHEPVIQPRQRRQKKRAWNRSTIRNRAMFVLESLFKHFRCGTPHEVLLKLIEDPDEDSVLPTLQLILSACPELELWQEARCDPAILYVCKSTCSSGLTLLTGLLETKLRFYLYLISAWTSASILVKERR